MQRLSAFLVLLALAAPASVAGQARRSAAKAKPKPAPVAAPDAARDARLFAEFGQRVAQYVELHREAKKGLPTLQDDTSPNAIAAHQKALAERIAALRAQARQGELFTPQLQPALRGILHREFKRHPPAREAVKEENPQAETPAAPVTLRVNGPYNAAASLSTTPPQVLQRLPPVPDDVLGYRFVGRNLVLCDAVAELIVDYMTEAVP
jgi:hypothetical protein